MSQDENKEQSGFGMPEGYFENSAARLLAQMEWLEEHRAYPQLSALNRKSGFIVPEGYFSENKLELIDYPTLSGMKHLRPFMAPAGYFDEAAVAIRTKLFPGVEEESIDLPGVPKTNPFAVPDNYFSQGREEIREILTPQKKRSAKIFSMRTVLQVAALLVIAVGLWLYRSYQTTVVENDCGGIACLDKNELLNAGDLQNSNSEDLYELVDPAALEKKLEKRENSSSVKPDSGNYIEDEFLLDDI